MEWVSHTDRRLRRAFGWTDFLEHVIGLDERLKHNPGKLAEIWVHEILHASLAYISRPKSFDQKLEEKIVTRVGPILALALRQ